MIILIIHIIFSYDKEYFIDFLCERWIPCQAVTSVLCLHYRPETVHCSTKDAYTSEITFLALKPCSNLYTVDCIQERELMKTFKIPGKVFINFLQTLEDHYIRKIFKSIRHLQQQMCKGIEKLCQKTFQSFKLCNTMS